MPPEMASYQSAFSSFYLAKHSGRRLAWLHALGTCVLRAALPCGVRELSVSVFQAAILLLFNDSPSLSLADIALAVSIEDGELRRTLQSLACGKVRVLTKTPKGKDVLDGDVFTVNDAFSEPRFRIKARRRRGGGGWGARFGVSRGAVGLTHGARRSTPSRCRKRRRRRTPPTSGCFRTGSTRLTPPSCAS